MKRYSNMAGFAFVLVVASGIINALIRIDVPAGMASAYGYILLLKTAATIFLGLLDSCIESGLFLL
ncbi:CopD family protein [Arthrobacter alpinus]|nr:CopD family protein [Arthrobacter alpinus]